MKERILITWIGHADLIAMSNKLPSTDKKKIEKIVGNSRKIDGVGPVKALVQEEKFKEIHLLNSYDNTVKSLFSKWIRGKTKFYNANIIDPTNHAQILGQVEAVLGTIKLKPNQELCFHLSPGTPAMAAIWIWLAKSKYPATLFQTSIQGGASKANVPFDVTVEVFPQLFSEPDRFWQHLVERWP